MPHMDRLIGEEMPAKRVLSVSLDTGDNILPCIRQAMKNNHIEECTAVEVNGSLKEATISYHDGQRQRYQVLRDTALLRATGTLKLSYDELYGALTITTAERAPLTGTLMRGKAGASLEFRFSFVPKPEKRGAP